MPGANWTGGGRFAARRQAKDKVTREHFGKQKILSQSMGGGLGRSVNRPDTSSISLAHANTTAAAVSSLGNFTLPNLGTAKNSIGVKGGGGEKNAEGVQEEVGKKKRKSELLDLLDDLDPSTFANKRQKILQLSNLVSLPTSAAKTKPKPSVPPQRHDDHITYEDIACAPPSLARSAYSGDDRISDDTTTECSAHRPRMAAHSHSHRRSSGSRSSSSSRRDGSFHRPPTGPDDDSFKYYEARPASHTHPSRSSRSSDTFSTDETRIPSHYGSGSFLSYSSPTSKSFGGVSSSSDRAQDYEDSFRADGAKDDGGPMDPKDAAQQPYSSYLSQHPSVDRLSHMHLFDVQTGPQLASYTAPPASALYDPASTKSFVNFDAAELPSDDNALLAELYDLPETASLDVRVAHLERVMARHRRHEQRPTSDPNQQPDLLTLDRNTDFPHPISVLPGTHSMPGSDALQLSDGQFDELEEKVREDMTFEMGLDIEADEDRDRDEWASWLGTNADGVGMGTGTCYEDEHDEMRDGVIFSHQYGPVHEEEDDAQDYGFPAYLRNDTDVDVGADEDVDKDFPATSTTTTMAYLNQNHSPTTQPLTRTRARPSTPASNSTSHLLTKKLTPIAEEETSSHSPPPPSPGADTDYVLNFQLKLDLERFNQSQAHERNQNPNQSPSLSPVASVGIATPRPSPASLSGSDHRHGPLIRILSGANEIDGGWIGIGVDNAAAAEDDAFTHRTELLDERPPTPHPHPTAAQEPNFHDQVNSQSQELEPTHRHSPAASSPPPFPSQSVIAHSNGRLVGPSLFASFALDESEDEVGDDEAVEWGR